MTPGDGCGAPIGAGVEGAELVQLLELDNGISLLNTPEDMEFESEQSDRLPSIIWAEFIIPEKRRQSVKVRESIS